MILIYSKLRDDRCEEIKRLAVRILKKCNISSYPIDCFKIADRLCFVKMPYSAMPKRALPRALELSDKGFTCRHPITDTPIIYYNDAFDSAVTRFTVAHEIAHNVLGHVEESDFVDQEANLFAKFMLTPPVILKILDLTPSGVESVFGVSISAAVYALKYMANRFMYGPKEYTDYEIELLAIFNDFIRKELEMG